MRLRVSVIAITLTATIAGCGGHAQTEGQRDVAYVKRVNVIEKQLSVPLAAVTHASARVASDRRSGPVVHRNPGSGAQETALLAALAKIHALGHTLAAVPAPPAATRLRSLLLRLIAQEAYLTGQTAKLVRFLPSFDAALKPLAAATVRLERALSVNQAYGASAVQTVYAQKAGALRTFRGTVQAVLARLRRFSPPAVSAPDYQAQVKSLRGMSLNAGKLADAIGTGQTTNVAGLLQAFDQAAVSNQSRTAQRAQIAAVKAYDAQTRKLAILTEDVERERLRLANTLQ